MNNQLRYRVTDWARGLIQKYRNSWNGLSILVLAEDSARPPESFRINYLVILFIACIVIIPPIAAVWGVVSKVRSGTFGDAMSGRMQLLYQVSLANREKQNLLELVDQRNEVYRGISRRYQQITFKNLKPAASGDLTARANHVSMRVEMKKLRLARQRLTALMQFNERATSLVENRMLIFHQIPRGLPVPAEDCQFVGKYGWRTDPETGTKSEFHTGVDVIAVSGTPILAPAPGRVIEVRNEGETGYGRFVRIHHGLGITTLFAHNSENFVKEGDLVRRGQKIALVGASGRTVGAHLHYEIKHGPDYEKDTWRRRRAEDPTEYLKNARGEHTCEI